MGNYGEVLIDEREPHAIRCGALSSSPHFCSPARPFVILPPSWPNPLDPKDIVTIDELAISNMWEVAAIREVLEKKGRLSKAEILEAIRDLRRENPTALTPLEVDDPPDQAFPEPYLITEAEDALITHIMDTMNGAKLNAHQAKILLHRCLRLLELGERIGQKTTHKKRGNAGPD